MNSNKHCIFYLSSHQVTPALKLLFDPSDPTSLRCFAVLEGNAQGRIFADHPLEPTWSVVHEAAFCRLFLGGRIHYPSLRKLFLRLHRHGNLWVGLSPDDPRLAASPPQSRSTRILTGLHRSPAPTCRWDRAVCSQRMQAAAFRPVSIRTLYWEEQIPFHVW